MAACTSQAEALSTIGAASKRTEQPTFPACHEGRWHIACAVTALLDEAAAIDRDYGEIGAGPVRADIRPALRPGRRDETEEREQLGAERQRRGQPTHATARQTAQCLWVATAVPSAKPATSANRTRLPRKPDGRFGGIATAMTREFDVSTPPCSSTSLARTRNAS